jgi:hypothetical protein
MTATAFTRNYRDHSNDTGFQFEFICDKCGNGFRSSFKANALGVGSKVLHGLGSLFGGGGNKLWQAGNAADHMKDGLRGGAWDTAFAEAIEEMRPKFHQCTRCGHWVCPEVCWNEARQLCEGCAPDLAEEAAAAQARVAADQMHDKIRNADQVGDIDPTAAMVGQCQHCKARLAPGAKFCAACGKPATAAAAAGAAAKFCSNCGKKIAPGGKFCGDCGTPAA